MTKNELLKKCKNKEELIIYAYENCEGMVLKDETLKGDMVDKILNWVPPVDEFTNIEVDKNQSAFESWYAEYLQTVDVQKPHHPEAHGCLGGNPYCELCDDKLPTAYELCEDKLPTYKTRWQNQ